MAKFSQAMIQGLLQPSFTQELGSAAKALGATPGLMMSERNRQESQAQTQQLLQQHANDPAMLKQLSQEFAVKGQTEISQLFLDASEKARAKQMGKLEAGGMQIDQTAAGKRTDADKRMLSAAKIQMAKLAESLNLPELANSVRQAPDKESLAAIAKDIRKAQIDRAPSQTPGQRLTRAVQSGISKYDFYDLGLDKASDSVFNDTLAGLKGSKTEAWMGPDGEVKAYRFLNGKVWNEETRTYVEPGELGLTAPAPAVQKVIDTSSKLASSLQEANAEDIITQRENARDAVASINRLDRQLGRVGGMPTGIAANIERGLRQVGQLIGMPYDPSLVNSETYMIEAATFVKEQIKAFGSGTGLSDKDLKFTEKMVGADPTLQAASLEKILRLYREAAVNTVESYNTLVTDTGKTLSEEDMIGFQTLEIPAEDQPELSSDALKYLTPKTGG